MEAMIEPVGKVDLAAQGGLPAFGRMLWRHRGEPGMLIPLLQAAQDTYGYIPPLAIEQIAEVTGIPASEVYGVITFYKQFRLQPLGKHLLKMCKGTACYVSGAVTMGQTIEDELGCAPEENTADGLFTFSVVACLGCCSLAPVVMIDDQAYGKLTPDKLRRILRQYKKQAGGNGGQPS
jgi:NADH-quinone oxidoreductase subunit E